MAPAGVLVTVAAVKSLIILTVPSLLGRVYVRAAVLLFVRKLVNVFSTLRMLILNNVRPATPPEPSLTTLAALDAALDSLVEALDADDDAADALLEALVA